MSDEFKVVYPDPPWNETGGGRIRRGADRHYGLIKKKEDILDAMTAAEEWKQLSNDSHCYMWVTNNFLPDGLWLMERLAYRYITNVAWLKNRFGIGRYFRGQHELLLFGVRGNGWSVRTPPNNIPSRVITDGPTLVESYLDALDILHDQRLLPAWTPDLDRGLLDWLAMIHGRLDAAEQSYVEGQGYRALPEIIDSGAIVADHVYREDGQRKHSAKPPVFYDVIEERSKGPYLEMFARSGRPGWTSWGHEAPKPPQAALPGV